MLLTLLLFFSVLSLYCTVSSIYRFSKGAGERMQIRHIERLELELRQLLVDVNLIEIYFACILLCQLFHDG